MPHIGKLLTQVLHNFTLQHEKNLESPISCANMFGMALGKIQLKYKSYNILATGTHLSPGLSGKMYF